MDINGDNGSSCEAQEFHSDMGNMKEFNFMSEKAYEMFLREHISSNSTEDSSLKLKMIFLCLRLQRQLCDQLKSVDVDCNFRVDAWRRTEGGGGVTCILQNGSVFSKAGVNISVVSGDMPEAAVASMNTNNRGMVGIGPLQFFATGISSVIHPFNPMVPTMHFNLRYFEAFNADGKTFSWFGGGSDLTPYYLIKEDVVHFHQVLKSACDKHSMASYADFKRLCDDYFHVKCRGERRGVGGIFFDNLQEPSTKECFWFMLSYANVICETYLPIVKRRYQCDYTPDNVKWQLLRRGRYVEFNLIYDRGTTFGLRTPGSRTESILMSLPATACWEYMHEPEADSEEAILMEVLRNPVDWIPLS